MSEKCRYGRDSEVFYFASEAKIQKYECPYEAEVDGFCMFHKEGYWKQNAETEQRVREAFLDELRNTKMGEELFCIGYHLPDIDDVWKEIKEMPGSFDFTKTIFQAIDFTRVIFHGSVWFESATFEGAARFGSAIFKREAGFESAIFKNEAGFESVIFENKAEFYGATFEGAARFSSAVFKSEAVFESAIFEDMAWFWEVKFEDETWFDLATFKSDTLFRKAKFEEEVWFNHATFGEEAEFDHATFEGRASFDGVIFKKMTTFEYTTFKEATLFRTTNFIKTSEESTDQELDDFIWFRRVAFDSPDKFIFESCDLKYISYIHTDITRIRFRDCTWSKPMEWVSDSRKCLSFGGEIDAYRLIDDLLFERQENKRGKDSQDYKKDPDLTIGNVLAVYRMLRENYEYHVDYETAGKFFVGEMEARRRTTKSFPDEIILWLYRTLSLYGQSYLRPLIALGAIIMIFAFARGLLGSLISFFQGACINAAVDIIVDSVIISLQFTGTEPLDVFQRVLSLTMLVLFGLALKRRFERRFRH